MKKCLPLVLLFLASIAFSQTPCEDGSAGIYDCFGIDLQALVTPAELGAENIGERWVNDLWGWTDPMTDKEYALVGMTNGTSFVDISDPVNPVVLGVLKEHNWDQQGANRSRVFHDGAKSVWRDIKVYGNYAYIVSEDSNHGLQVFDLTELRDVSETPADFQETGHYDGLGKSHNINVNEESGFLYAVGFNQQDRTCSSGGLHVVDLADPVNPVYAGCYDHKGYIHDTQCVNYIGPDSDHAGKEICFNSNGNQNGPNTITIVDFTNKGTPTLLSEGEYEDAFYAHQGWLTEDHKYFISNDELDELNTNEKTKTFIWDVQDLDNPTLLGTYSHQTKAIDHNLYIKGDTIYQSNYTNGLRLLDATKISEGILKELLYFDVDPTGNATTFEGTWSNYPFFKSGNIIVSDLSKGLFILKPQADPGEPEEIALSVDLESRVNIFPNPAAEQITVELDGVQKATFQLININGQVVLSRNLKGSSNAIDIDGLASGIYLMKVQSGERKTVKKIIVR